MWQFVSSDNVVSCYQGHITVTGLKASKSHMSTILPMFYHIYVSINFHKDVNIDRIGSMFYVTLFTGMLYLSTVLNGVAQKTEQIIIIIYLLTYLLTYLLNHSLTD